MGSVRASSCREFADFFARVVDSGRGVAGVPPSAGYAFDLGDLVACVERETTVCVHRAVIVVFVVVPPPVIF